MNKPSITSETQSAALAAELRISLGKLIRRLREQTHPNDFTSAQKSVLLRLDRDGPSTVSALARAEGWRAAVEALRLVYEGRPVQVTISAGVATYPQDGGDEDSLLRAADEALYRSKAGGRNRVSAYAAG